MSRVTLNTIDTRLEYMQKAIDGLVEDMKRVDTLETEVAVMKQKTGFINIAFSVLNVTIMALATAFNFRKWKNQY